MTIDPAAGDRRRFPGHSSSAEPYKELPVVSDRPGIGAAGVPAAPTGPDEMPRVWWDGRDFVYLLPGPLLGQEGHAPRRFGFYRARSERDLEPGSVELRPVSGDTEVQWAVFFAHPEGWEDVCSCNTETEARELLRFHRSQTSKPARLMRCTVTRTEWREVEGG